MKLIRHLFTKFIDFLFPKSELVRSLEAMESNELIARLKQTTIQLEKPPSNIISLFAYRNLNVHAVIHEIKYSANRILAQKIAPALYEALLALVNIHNPNQRPIVTFIPTTQNRKEKRGFDQGSIILDAIRAHDAKVNSREPHLCFNYDRNVLAWSRNVSQQSLTTNKEERLANMNNALVSTIPSLSGKTIFVLDDVCTTGATLTDARRALEAAGAMHVYLLTIAH